MTEPSVVSPEDEPLIARCTPFTLTSPARLQAVIDAVRYVERAGIPGAFAECGVWRGGSVLAMALTLSALGSTERDLYLYDTFSGMTKPTAEDVAVQGGAAALARWEPDAEDGGEAWSWTSVGARAVRATLLESGCPAARIHLVEGPVEQTLPAAAPDGLALLRLDTDWYASTRHELQHLYPLLAVGGVLIVDDYGHWDGARRAVDEYFADTPVLLSRTDYTGRMTVKR